MGIGLPICRSIVGAHGGDAERGARGHLPLRAAGDLVAGAFRLRDAEVLR
jgi:hypothetical protein